MIDNQPEPAPRRPSATRATHVDLTDAEILRRGLEAFSELGYEGASVRELAKRLGVNHNFINDRFGSKNNFWRAVAHAASSPSSFTVPPGCPSIANFTPTSGSSGSTVVITGTNFLGTSAVRFNGVAATYVVNSPTQITAVVPGNATTGRISVTNPSGTATSENDFVVAGSSAPSITSLDPSSGCPGTRVAISARWAAARR